MTSYNIMRRLIIRRSLSNHISSRGGIFSRLAVGGRSLTIDGWTSHRWQNNFASTCMSPSTASFLAPNSTLHQSNNLNRTSIHFSTAAMPQEVPFEPEPSSSTVPKQQRSKRKPMRKRNPLIITPTAAARIQFLIDKHNENGSNEKAMGIRLGTKKRGCNGLSYTLNYAYENHLDKHLRDEAMVISLDSPDMPGDGLKVYVEPMALMNVIGTTMDFVDDEMSSEFTFTNPNSKGECGCGESFNV